MPDVHVRDYLEEGEKILWRRTPTGGEHRRALLFVQVAGHVLLTAVAALFALSTVLPLPLSVGIKVTLTAILCVAINGPLVVWALYKWPRLRWQGDSLCFVTEHRFALVRASGELRQVPVHADVKILVFPTSLAFKLGDHAEVTFAGLAGKERQLVQTLAMTLIRKARAQAQKTEKAQDGKGAAEDGSDSSSG